jgi:Flp pilus assembly pilin Flp
MLQTFKTFASDESGAVTVDWVVLTAALVGLGLAVMGVIAGGLETVSQNIDNCLTGAIGTTGAGATGTGVDGSTVTGGTGTFAVSGC